MADAIWERKFRGELVSVSLEDLTIQRMRQIKRWFGDDYGIPAKFISMLLMGEVDALTSALWVHSEVSGAPIGSPLDFVFNLSEFEEPDEPKAKSGSGKAQAGNGAGQITSPKTQTS